MTKQSNHRDETGGAEVAHPWLRHPLDQHHRNGSEDQAHGGASGVEVPAGEPHEGADDSG